MLEQNRPYVYLKWVLDSIEKIENYSKNITSFEEFADNTMVFDAVLMQLIHIGEIINKFYKNYSDKFEINIPYKDIIGFRNFVAHNYLGIRKRLVWNIIRKEIPKLKIEILNFLKKSDFSF